MSARERFVFSNLPSSRSREAFEFHTRVAGNNPHLALRSEEAISGYCDESLAFGASNREGRFVGFCYTAFAEKENEWELGGITVDSEYQGRKIASVLTRLAVAHTLVWNDPWKEGQRFISHVHEENPEPRPLLSAVGFIHERQVVIPGTVAPPGLKRNAAGDVIGDEFLFPRAGLRELLKWFEAFDAWAGTSAPIEPVLELAGTANVATIVEGLRDMVSEYLP